MPQGMLRDDSHLLSKM